MNNTINKSFSIYKFFICLYCIALGCRELFASLGKPVYIYLLLLYIIPLALLCYELVRYKVIKSHILSILCLIFYYLFFSKTNINGLKLFLPLVLAGIAFRNLDFKYIARYFLIIQSLSLLLRFLLLSGGIIQETVTYAGWKSDGFSHDLGFGNPNAAGTIFFFLNCMIYMVLFKKSKFLSFFIILSITIIMYQLTICRTAAFASLLLLLSYFFPYRFSNKFIKSRIIFMGIPLIIVLLPMCFLSFQLFGINDLMSGRLSIIAYIFNQFKSTQDILSGIYIDDLEGIPIDNVFAYLLVYGGVLSWIIFGKLYISLYKNRMYIDLYILIVILCIIFSGIGESAWAVYGRFGASFFWILLMNKTLYINSQNNKNYFPIKNIK